jgi:hypothetical protein
LALTSTGKKNTCADASAAVTPKFLAETFEKATAQAAAASVPHHALFE